MFLAPDTELPPKPELVAQGWVRRFMAGPGRSKEAVELYTALGYEVHLEPVIPADLSDDCKDCRLATGLFVTVYTRPLVKKPGPG